MNLRTGLGFLPRGVRPFPPLTTTHHDHHDQSQAAHTRSRCSPSTLVTHSFRFSTHISKLVSAAHLSETTSTATAKVVTSSCRERILRRECNGMRRLHVLDNSARDDIEGRAKGEPAGHARGCGSMLQHGRTRWTATWQQPVHSGHVATAVNISRNSKIRPRGRTRHGPDVTP